MQPDFIDGSNQGMVALVEAMSPGGKYAELHRSFGNGAVHGAMAALLGALPIPTINSLFERRGWKYIMVHFGYWLITMILISGAVCQFL